VQFAELKVGCAILQKSASTSLPLPALSVATKGEVPVAQKLVNIASCFFASSDVLLRI